MCTVSMIIDDYSKIFPQKWDRLVDPNFWPAQPGLISRQEFDTLKAEVEELKRLITSAKKYDEATGQPECESAEKMELLRKLANIVGVDLRDLADTETGDYGNDSRRTLRSMP